MRWIRADTSPLGSSPNSSLTNSAPRFGRYARRSRHSGSGEISPHRIRQQIGCQRRHTMTNTTSNQLTQAFPLYLGGDDPSGRFNDYYPAWLDNIADDVTLEGSMLDGAVQGAE